MKAVLDIHEIQRQIIVSLLLRPRQSFSQLNKNKLSTDQFNFHLKSLVESKIVEKTSQGYALTTIGKEFGNRFDTEKIQIEKQAKVGVLLVCQRKDKGVLQYLIQQRLKEPYYGYHGFFGGKVRHGETIMEAARRELNEETALSAELEMVKVKHKMDYSPDKELLEDKIFFVFKATKVKGNLKTDLEEGKNTWMTKEEILQLPNLFDGVEETLTMLRTKQIQFVETKYSVTGF